jgi:hypothetical protein
MRPARVELRLDIRGAAPLIAALSVIPMSDGGATPIPPLPDDFLAQNTPAIDAQEIMATIRRRIAEKQQAGLYRGLPRLALDTPPPPGAVRRVEERLALLKMYARHDLAGPPISSHRRFTGWMITAWKRFTRFWIRSYSDSLFLRQQAFNEEVATLLEELTTEVKAIRERLDEPNSRDS